MASTSSKPTSLPSGQRVRPGDVDHIISLRIRQRRILLGLTTEQMAELIGVTSQQAHKYQTGMNRISVGRLYQIAQALGVDAAYFFEDIDPEKSDRPKPADMTPQ